MDSLDSRPVSSNKRVPKEIHPGQGSVARVLQSQSLVNVLSLFAKTEKHPLDILIGIVFSAL